LNVVIRFRATSYEVVGLRLDEQHGNNLYKYSILRRVKVTKLSVTWFSEIATPRAAISARQRSGKSLSTPLQHTVFSIARHFCYLVCFLGIRNTSSGSCSPNRFATHADGTSRISRIPLNRSSLTAILSDPSLYTPITIPVLPLSGPDFSTIRSRTRGGSIFGSANTRSLSLMPAKYGSKLIVSS